MISHKLLGTNEWFVVQHTECGMVTFTDEVMGDLLAESLDTASYADGKWSNAAKGEGSPEGRYINWLTIRDLADSVREDVGRIRAHPLVSPSIPIHGFIYDVKTGRLVDVEGASLPAA